MIMAFLHFARAIWLKEDGNGKRKHAAMNCIPKQNMTGFRIALLRGYMCIVTCVMLAHSFVSCASIVNITYKSIVMHD